MLFYYLVVWKAFYNGYSAFLLIITEVTFYASNFYIFECDGKNLFEELWNFILFANSKMVTYIPTKMKQI